MDKGNAGKRQKQNLKNAIYEGTSFLASTGFGDNYVSAYAVLRGATEQFIGLLASVPLALGLFLQALSPFIMKKMRHRKGLVTAFSFLGALSWLLILGTAFVAPETALPLLLAFFSIYTILLYLEGTIFSSWIADLVPESIRGTYFGQRNSWIQIASVVATLSAGIILDLFKDSNAILGFCALFALAFLCRMLSWHFLSKMDDPHYDHGKTLSQHPLDFLKKGNPELRHLIILFGAFIFMVNLVSPFFVLYMLRTLGFSYLEFMAVILASQVATVFAAPYWGRVSTLHGNKIVLSICLIIASVVPLYWFFLTSFWQLALFELISGVAWSGIYLCLFNHILAKSKSEEVSSNVSNRYFFAGIGLLLGPNIGALVLISLGETTLFSIDAIHVLMILSAIGRLAVALAIILAIKESSLLLDKKRRALLVSLTLTNPVREFVGGTLWVASMATSLAKGGVHHAIHSSRKALGAVSIRRKR
ncbi:MAG: MFS transporter [Candidatus Micrarchaeota archaeon]|nr:MFS transporter [Candidatus Micrarchaeota archaeon]